MCVLQFVKRMFFNLRASGRLFFAVAFLGCLVLSAGAKPYGLTARPAIGAFLNGTMPETAPGISGNWSAVVAFTNLLFTNAVGLTFVPGTDELCVWEREGRVWTFQNSAGATRKKLMLDIHNQCQGWDDSGLLGRGVPSGLRDEPCRFRLLHLGQAWHGRGRSLHAPESNAARHLPRPALAFYPRRERRGHSRLRNGVH